MIGVHVATTQRSVKSAVLRLMSQGFPGVVGPSNRKTVSLQKRVFSQAMWSPYLLPLFLNSKENQNNNNKSSEDKIMLMMMAMATGIR